MLLTPVEARVLAVLIEKRLTVPDTYPLTLNALVAGCNQKSSRDPVMTLSESQVQDALDRLKRLSLAIESSGSRVMRYSENMKRVLCIPNESVALLAVLMLRGPQTAAELRANAERLQRFSDASAMDGFLRELAQWPAGALVAELPRQPGARENRWMHLLSGPPPAAEAAAQSESPSGASGSEPAKRDLHSALDALQQRVAALESEVAALRAQLQPRDGRTVD
ncbi:MAG TPA: DUF480 domain-containing protein [Burkholderiaceae bacterium]|nr:DUF480 domain-containing protein [Burkholderiaceae bacterium]